MDVDAFADPEHVERYGLADADGLRLPSPGRRESLGS
jgi:hypothetical protein